MIEIGGVRVLYTGDYSREEVRGLAVCCAALTTDAQDRHLMAAEVPPVRPEVLIVEATYGVQMHERTSGAIGSGGNQITDAPAQQRNSSANSALPTW